MGSSQDAWERISKGATVGKRINLPVTAAAAGSIQRTQSKNFFQVGSEKGDGNALQLAITLIPPTIIANQQLPGGLLDVNSSLVDAATSARDNGDIYLHPAAPATPTSIANYVCKCEWAIGGVQSSAEIDFSNGLVINIAASWARLSAFADAIPQANILSHIATLGAYIGPGYPKPNNAQRTYFVGSVNTTILGVAGVEFPDVGFNGTPTNPVNADAPNGYPIPAFAKQVSVLGYIRPQLFKSLNTFDANIHFARDNNMGDIVGTFHVSSERQGPIIVPNGAYFWTIQNNTVGLAPIVSAVFDLAI